jgi:alkaline phosphatase D
MALVSQFKTGSLIITRAEVSNNGYRDGSSALNNTEESFRKDGPSISVDQRKMNAVRAYFEWMPIR